MTPELVTVIVTIITTVGGIWMARINADVQDLRERVAELEEENDELWEGVGILSGQLRESGVEPAWTPSLRRQRQRQRRQVARGSAGR